MTRVKEVDPNSGDMPDYKSPANRLVHSLRKGYDNLRGKLQETRNKIKFYQIKTRDLEISRNRYKEEILELKKKISNLQSANENLEKQTIAVKKKKLEK